MVYVRANRANKDVKNTVGAAAMMTLFFVENEVQRAIPTAIK
tara:strand:+ start:1191 stop:1316 length:126 start_codon:yes stop_codon:yes gene_type:complete